MGALWLSWLEAVSDPVAIIAKTANQELSFKKNPRKKCFFCADLWSAKVFSMLITFNWSLTSPVILDTHQANTQFDRTRERRRARRNGCFRRLEGLFWKSVVAGEKLPEKLQEAVCCQFFQGSTELLENVSSKSWLGSTWLVRCGNENCPSQISNDAF